MIFLAIVAEYDLDYDSLDVKTAFLYPSLHPEDKVLMKRPYGITDAHMPPIVELNKALYDLLKASQYFEEFLSEALLKLGFILPSRDSPGGWQKTNISGRLGSLALYLLT